MVEWVIREGDGNAAMVSDPLQLMAGLVHLGLLLKQGWNTSA